MTKPYGPTDMVGNHLENEPVMKCRKEETTCLLDVAVKCSVKASVHVPVKGKKDKSPAPEPVIKDGKREMSSSCKSKR